MRRSRLLVLTVLLAGCTSTHVVSQPSTTVQSTPAPPGSCRYVGTQTQPDPACTPGVTNPAVTQANIHSTICVRGWTATIRPPTSYTNALKLRQMRVYTLTGPPSAYEEDHRIPLEVGGNPTNPANLWPEPWNGPYGAHTKDLIENEVRKQVCSGQLTLAQGQAAFTGNWWTFTYARNLAYLTHKNPLVSTSTL